MYSFPYLEPVCCSMPNSKCCFLTCIQISQKAGQVVWYSYLFKNFPQFLVIHTVKSFGVVNKAEVDIFLEISCFFDEPIDVHNLISGSSAFSKSSFFGIAFLWDWNKNWPFPVLCPLLSFPNLLAYWVQHFHNAKECFHCTQTVALISHASEVMLKILQARLQQ